MASVLEDQAIEAAEADVAEKAFDQLVAKQVLERHGGAYYLKGRAPRPFDPFRIY